ncbi:MAG: hypothetical protein Q9157_007748 [Trypethelium eluteriae]
MPAPTALLRAPDQLAEASSKPEEPETSVILDPTALPENPESTQPTTSSQNEDSMQIDAEGRPKFAPSASQSHIPRVETRKVPIPPHRMTPLKANWSKIYPPLVEHLKLQVRMNVKAKAVELRTSKHTADSSALQKGEDFIRAFTLGFEVEDAIAFVRLDNQMFIQTFEIKDVKNLQGEHMGRAIGRFEHFHFDS